MSVMTWVGLAAAQVPPPTMAAEQGLTLDAGLGLRRGGLSHATGLCVDATVGHRWRSRLWLGARWSGCQPLDVEAPMEHRVEAVIGPDLGSRIRVRPHLAAGLWLRPDADVSGTVGPAVDVTWQTGRWRLGGRVQAGADVARDDTTWTARPAVGVGVVVGWGPRVQGIDGRDGQEEPEEDVSAWVSPPSPSDEWKPIWKCGAMQIGCEWEFEPINLCDQEEKKCETEGRRVESQEKIVDRYCQFDCTEEESKLGDMLRGLQSCYDRVAEMRANNECWPDTNPFGM